MAQNPDTSSKTHALDDAQQSTHERFSGAHDSKVGGSKPQVIRPDGVLVSSESPFSGRRYADRPESKRNKIVSD
ncbi:hypothetical protein EW145_g2490 [Phellinidium pouzarii]|uniref:Uncharacterized protein n=1 Tax=Phellinidium pouzarii TaxID=167371 RepID=A0A4S4LCL2_9AGAM|nr:hypothetical protein EW145_g2490 [Phellinidium pouzarii]